MELRHIDEDRLENDLTYRVGFVSQFMDFGPADIDVVHAAADLLAPLIPTIVDTIYDKLFSYDATKRHFVPRQHGYEGEVPESVESLTQSHEQIRFRKEHLGRYLTRLLTAPFDDGFFLYLDVVGQIHTREAGNEQIHVPLVQMNALMGFLADAVFGATTGLGLDHETETKTIRAFSKLLWIQNDLIVKHYERRA